MVLEYQNDPNTYSAYGQYLLGEQLLIAPLWSDTTFSREIYLPEGEWIDFWDKTKYKGKQTIIYNAPIDKAPILVKAGAIIPMAPDGQSYVDQKKSPLTIRIYPKGRASFTLYEDDGASYDYEKGVFASTTFWCAERKDGLLLTKSAPRGSYKIPQRDHIIEIHKKMNVMSVRNDGIPIPRYDTKADFDAATEGWFYDLTANIIWARIKGGANELFSLGFVTTATDP
jgi:alpha-glucosidase (family GH31 glycosyl hydrolase)